MKRILSFFLILLFAALPLVACGGHEVPEGAPKPGSLPTKTLNVYNWGQYISDGSDDLPDTNDLFETYFNETVLPEYGGKTLAEHYGYFIEVNYSTYPSNEDMYNKIVSGSASFDVVVPSDYMIERMIAEELLLPLTEENSKKTWMNLENIDERFLNGTYNTYDPKAEYSVPYTFSAVGIIYNTNYVDEEDVGSWDLLWNPKYKGKILQFNNPRDAFGTALYKLGYSVNTPADDKNGDGKVDAWTQEKDKNGLTDKDKWEAAYQLLREQKPLVSAYVMDEIFDKMINGSGYIAPYYAGDFLTMYDSNNALAFYYPEEGTNVFVDAMCIPRCARNVDAAREYIDFMLSEEPAIANAEYIGYGSPNLLVKDLSLCEKAECRESRCEDPECDDPQCGYNKYMRDWHEDAIKILYEDLENLTVDNLADLRDIEGDGLKASFYRAQADEILTDTNDLWSDFKSENAIPAWIIVADILIVGALAGAVIIFFVRRRIRSKYY